MLIPVVCPDCAANFDIPDSYAGKKVRCPQANCGAVIAVPDPCADELELVDDEMMATPLPEPSESEAVARLEDDNKDDEDSRHKRSQEISSGADSRICGGPRYRLPD